MSFPGRVEGYSQPPSLPQHHPIPSQSRDAGTSAHGTQAFYFWGCQATQGDFAFAEHEVREMGLGKGPGVWGWQQPLRVFLSGQGERSRDPILKGGEDPRDTDWP